MQQDKIDKKIDSFFSPGKISLEEIISEQLNPILELLQEESVSPEVGVMKDKKASDEKATTLAILSPCSCRERKQKKLISP